MPGPGVFQPGPPRDRPHRGVGPDEAHRPRWTRPTLSAPPQAQDLRRLAPRTRTRQASLASARRAGRRRTPTDLGAHDGWTCRRRLPLRAASDHRPARRPAFRRFPRHRGWTGRPVRRRGRLSLLGPDRSHRDHGAHAVHAGHGSWPGGRRRLPWRAGAQPRAEVDVVHQGRGRRSGRRRRRRRRAGAHAHRVWSAACSPFDGRRGATARRQGGVDRCTGPGLLARQPRGQTASSSRPLSSATRSASAPIVRA
jgi:hypothetical protein